MAYTTINKSSLHMNTKLYTGTGSAMNITGVGFQPDMTWIKPRSVVDNHILYDAVRGVTKIIRPNLNLVEGTVSTMITAFNSDGFSLGTNGNVTANNATFASWNWKANGAGSANTAGSINSTVSVNATSGFSIVSYTGTGANATVGHGLGSLCKFIIIKRLNSTNDWEIGSTALGWDKHLYFNNGAANTSSNRWQSTAPTNSVFYLGPPNGNNASSSPYIAYCFAEKQGYSKFGSYIGNGNVNGTFVYTGFSPAFVMIKETSDTGNWCMSDNKRDGYNPTKNLYVDSTGVENTANTVDHCSNGFKIRTTGGSVNTSGSNMIYMAFAEAPLVGTNGVTAKAR